MTSDQLMLVAKQELRTLDRRCLFWIALGVETAVGSNTSATDVDWSAYDWSAVREGVNEWLDALVADTGEAAYRWPAPEDLRLCFIARPRRAAARGYRRLPSLNIADPNPLAALRFEDGETASLDSLPIETVRDLSPRRGAMTVTGAAQLAAGRSSQG